MSTNQEELYSTETVAETMHFFRQYAAQDQIKSFADSTGSGVHPDSYEYNILGQIAAGDTRPAVELLPNVTGLQEAASVMEKRLAQFGSEYDKTLVEAGAERYERDAIRYLRRLGAQYTLLRRYVDEAKYYRLLHEENGQSHSGYVELSIAMGDDRDAETLLLEGIALRGESDNLEMRMIGFSDNRFDEACVSWGYFYHELLQLPYEELLARAERRGIYTEDCEPFTVKDYIQRSL